MVKVDKEILLQFFSLPADKVTQVHIKELTKVIEIVLIKHFSKYYYIFQELKDAAIEAICMRRDKYDPSFSPYNYCYTVFRNEIGNKINRFTREQSVPDIRETLKTTMDIASMQEAELPPEIERYREALLGMKDFTMERIPRRDVLPVIMFIKLHETPSKAAVPEFVLDTTRSINILYKLLNDIIQ